jgi:hypothetical protein
MPQNFISYNHLAIVHQRKTQIPNMHRKTAQKVRSIAKRCMSLSRRRDRDDRGAEAEEEASMGESIGARQCGIKLHC